MRNRSQGDVCRFGSESAAANGPKIAEQLAPTDPASRMTVHAVQGLIVVSNNLPCGLGMLGGTRMIRVGVQMTSTGTSWMSSFSTGMLSTSWQSWTAAKKTARYDVMLHGCSTPGLVRLVVEFH